MTPQQQIALTKLAVAPAFENVAGAPVGVAKHHDGSTLNGNLIHSLRQAGWITCTRTGETRIIKWHGSKGPVYILKYEITVEGLSLLND